MIALYGISNCDSCRKARRWLDEAGVTYRWVDLRADPIDSARVESWRAVLGDAVLINKRSKTWRDFDTNERAAAEAEPIPALIEHPTLIKRPVLETGETVLAGFSDSRYRVALSEIVR